MFVKEGNAMSKKGTILIVVVLSLAVLVQYSQGKDYPTKPIEIVCPYTPGGTTDLMSRLIADIAPKYLGQPLIVVNKPGGAGSIAAADVISSKPDGYKLVILSNFFQAINVKTQKVPFDPSHVVPIANFMEIKHGLCVRGDSPWKTLGDLLDYARKNPGKLRWSHHGRGGTIHIIPLLIFKKAGAETIDVPYKGAPEHLSALLGGHVDASSNVYDVIKDHLKAGKVRLLVFYSDRRFSEPHDVPSAVELGFTEVGKLATLFGLYVHKDTPEEIKKNLIEASKKIFEDPEFKKGMEKLGQEPKYGGPEFINESIKKGEEVGVPIIKELGLYIGK
jgi:tripartite-type tricarboxylate transporter receptor subunit TctC